VRVFYSDFAEEGENLVLYKDCCKGAPGLDFETWDKDNSPIRALKGHDFTGCEKLVVLKGHDFSRAAEAKTNHPGL
jgi:hypothetical protein